VLVTSATFAQFGLPDGARAAEDAEMNRESAQIGGKYGASPLARHDRALETARALLVLEVARESINFELRRQHGFTEGQAAAVIREASAQIPTRVRPQPVRRRAR
jgi:hypothetical protein